MASNNIIDGALAYLGNQTTMADVLFRTGTQVTGISLNANTGVNVTTKGVTEVPTPTGYYRLMYGVITAGASSVIPTSINSYWVQNTGTSSVTFSATPFGLFAKKN